jgi:hypothetical protein
MQRSRAFLLNLLTVAISLAVTLLLMEAVLRFLPVAWAPPVQPPTADNPIQRYVANTPFTWSIGWDFAVVAHGRTNAQGFVASYNYDAGARTPLVAVIGDSYVEAMMVPFSETLTGRLHEALGGRGRAYAFAQAGSPISQYVAYARHACALYRPERVVVVVVGNDFDESVYPHRARDGIHHLYPRADGGFDYRLTPLPPPGLIERVARHSALALYLLRNVKVLGLLRQFGFATAQAAPGPYVANTSAEAGTARITEGEQVIDWFVRELPAAACLGAKDIVLVIDAARPNIYDAASLESTRGTYFGLLRASLIAKARAAGFAVVDMEPAFRAAFLSDGRRFEHPDDGHWNAHGHAIVAEAVKAALGDWIAR